MDKCNNFFHPKEKANFNRLTQNPAARANDRTTQGT